MIEKRFTHKKWYDERQLFDGDEPFAIVDVYNQAEIICDKLNELYNKEKGNDIQNLKDELHDFFQELMYQSKSLSERALVELICVKVFKIVKEDLE